MEECQKDCFLRREFGDGDGSIQVPQHGVVTPDPTVSDVRKAHSVMVCVVRDVLAGGSFVVIAAGTQDAIGTIDTDVPTDETHYSVG